MIHRIGAWCLLVLGVLGCASTPGPGKKEYTSGENELRDPTVATRSLDKAQAAYLAGRWDEAVVAATRVIEGGAGSEEYYVAVKILGMASCNRKDPRPVAFAWIRLQPADRDALRGECSQNGLHITDEGKVTPAEGSGP